MSLFKLHRKHYRRAAYSLLGVMAIEIFSPLSAFALTSGPAQPEFTSFEPVATTELVDDFTGDFTYNIPVLQVPGSQGGGYQLSLSYHSGTTPEEESSWVGYGWTLNAGSINRNKVGFADDWKGQEVKFVNKAPVNATVEMGASTGFELFSFDIGSANGALRYNNYRGFGYSAGVGLNFGSGIVSLGYQVSDNEGSFSVKVSPAKALSRYKQRQADKKAESENKNNKEAEGEKDQKTGNKKVKKTLKQMAGAYAKSAAISYLEGNNYGLTNFTNINRTTSITKYNGVSFNVAVNIMPTPGTPEAGTPTGLFGKLSVQKNKFYDTHDVFGYLYSHEVSDEEEIMDYSLENESTYNKRDKFLSIPFNNADIYSASGEGMSGSFRAYKLKNGHFRPNKKKSTTHIFNVGAEVEAGVNNGGGNDVGYGQHILKIADWEHDGEDFSPLGDDRTFFRFKNDMGGQLVHDDASVESAGLKPTGLLATMFGGGFLYDVAAVGNKNYTPNVSHINTELNNSERPGRSSYIGYNLNADMIDAIGGIGYKAYNKRADIESFVSRHTSQVATQIGEYSIVNENGQRYVYGLPVYSRKERNMAYDANNPDLLIGKHLMYKDINGINTNESGTVSDAPYASSYLLTEITDPDYVDRTNDGPSEDDFGGWTKFNYQRIYGSDNKETGGSWYTWRHPYTGFEFDRNSLSDRKDDMISFSQGEKEIYFLESIETRTHIADFIYEDRKDAHDAPATAATDPFAVGTRVLKKLLRIELKSKKPGGGTKLIKTTHFDYEYSLCSNVPNGTGYAPQDSGTGKLTLKKLWFEHQDIHNAYITPYEFEYEYSTADYPTPYNSLENYGSGLDENPDYSHHQTDAWGNYRADGQARFDDDQPWVDQTPVSSFDPAAWQLKVIKLPSGGEIHVQYEQDDYAYVQDEMAHGMMSLESAHDENNLSNNKYYLRHEDHGLNTAAQRDELVDLIQDYYIQKGNRMYFKFLYKLVGLTPADLDDCNVDYIDGYVPVQEVGITNNRVWVRLGANGSAYNLPIRTCRDFTRTQRLGMVSSTNCDPVSGFGTSVPGTNVSAAEVVAIAESFINFLAINMMPFVLCKDLDIPHSYVRVPMVNAKKGGGVRVKRIMMYDQSTATGENTLYGREYRYETYDHDRDKYISSGVAAYEPQGIREENPIVTALPRFKQGWLNRIVTGRDKKQSEGPIGEHIYPGPSVGYSKVIVENIHVGKTGTGFTTKTFYTAKDFPVKTEVTGINQRIDYLLLPAGFINKSVNNIWLTQGFKFTVNSMHGSPRAVKSYANNYVQFEAQNRPLVSGEEYEYFEPGEKLPIFHGLDDIKNEPRGQEMDITMASKMVRDHMVDGNVEGDVDVGMLGFIPIPFVTGFPSFSHSETELYSHSTTKVISYPTVVKSKRVFRDGIYHETHFTAFNRTTGKPIITKTNDAFDRSPLTADNSDYLYSSAHDGSYVNYQFPGWMAYSNLEQTASNEREYIDGITTPLFVIRKVNATTLTFEPPSNGGVSGICDAMSKLTPGDLIEVNNATGKELYHIEGFDGNNLIINNAYYSPTNTIANNMTVDLMVVRSGRTNQLSTNIGELTTYKEQPFVNQPLSGTEFNNRTDLASQLNSFINAASNGSTYTPTGGALNLSMELPYRNECTTIGAIGMSFRFDVIGNKFYISTILGDGQPPSFSMYNEVGGELACDYMLTNQSFNITDRGYFAIDPENGNLVYYPIGNDCHPVKPICFQFCNPIYPKYLLDNVITASATTMDENWDYDQDDYSDWSGLTNRNDYELGKRGKWRPASSHVYRAGVNNVPVPYVAATNQRNYNTGMFDMALFNWKEQGANTSEWWKTNQVLRYAPWGAATEDENALGIPSTAKVGYDQTQAYVTAQNCPYEDLMFEGFEYNYGTAGSPEFEEHLDINTGSTYITYETSIGHSGNASLKIDHAGLLAAAGSNPEASLFQSEKFILTANLKSKGIIYKYWVKNDDQLIDNYVQMRDWDNGGGLPNFAGGSDSRRVAQVGEWSLYQTIYKPSDFNMFSLGEEVTFSLVVKTVSGSGISNGTLYVDDIRMAPFDAAVQCYVYDIDDFKLLASFDNQHFGTYFIYDPEGRLIRKEIETERGRKIIGEAHHNQPQKTR